MGELVVGGGRDGKEEGGWGKKEMDGMCFVDMGLCFYLFGFSGGGWEGGGGRIVCMGRWGLRVGGGEGCGGIRSVELDGWNVGIGRG